jgi:hypothetical protein
MRAPRALVAVLLAVSVPACGSDDEFEPEPDSDVSGVYNVSITNGQNGCNFENWVEGESTTGIKLTVTQEGKALAGSVDDVAGALFSLWIGTNLFQGEVDGGTFTLVAFGTSPRTQQGCVYTLNANVSGRLVGDAVNGTIVYRPATNDHPDCSSVECTSEQTFSGSRPPR